MLFIENSRKDAAEQDKGADDDREDPRPMDDIREHALVVHYQEEPWRDDPGKLGDKVTGPLQSCPFMIIGRYFIPERDPWDRIAGKPDQKQDLDS